MEKHRRKYEKQNLRRKNFKIFFIVFVILVCLLSILTVLARYVTNSIKDYFLESREFYFYSDKLTSDGAYYQIDNWSGVEDYSIIINMNSMANNLKRADYDIGYTVTYQTSNNVICQISKTEGIISSQTNTDSFNLKITPNTRFEDGDSATIEIVATSTTDYEKELRATFRLVVGQEKVTYQIEDERNNPYLELNITNTQSYYWVREAFDNYTIGDRINIQDYLNLSDTNKEKCYSAKLTLTFEPQEIVIDSTDKNYLNAKNIEYTTVSGYEYVKEIEIEIEAMSSENIRFYKKDKTKDYTYPIINE